MKELIGSIEQTMSSREIAELTGKEHKNVLRDCENLNANYEKLSLLKIEPCDYKAENGQTYREFRLTKMQTFDLLTGYRVDLRIKVNRRWAELETQALKPALPTSYKEALLELVKKEEEKEALLLENQAQQEIIKAQAPKVLFADAVSTSKTTILVGEMAKILKQNGVNIGQNRLFEWLRKKSYLISRKGGDFNMPTQKAMDLGLFEIKETSITHSDGHISITKTPKITGKGQSYFINKFLKKELQAL